MDVWITGVLIGLLIMLTAWLFCNVIKMLLRGGIGPTLQRAYPFGTIVVRGMFFAGWISLMFFIPWLILFVVVPYIIFRIHKWRAERRAVLWQLSFAVNRNLPLDDELDLIAPSFSFLMRPKLQKLAFFINKGDSLPEALLKTKGVVSRETAIAAQLGLENGNLVEVLKSEAIRSSQTPEWMNTPSFSPAMFLNYMVMVPLIGMNIVFFLMWWIMPKFKKIFEGFNMELPYVTESLIAASNTVVDYFYLPPALVILFVIAFGLYVVLFVRQNKDVSLLPIWKHISRRYRLPAVLRLLSQSVSVEQPIIAPLKHLSAMHKQGAIRNAAAESALAIEAGENVWKTLHAEGLLKSQEAELLASAERTGNLPWMMNELANGIERNRVYKWLAWLQFVEPVVIILIGLIVGFIAIGMFVPLIKIIHGLS